MLDNYKEYLPRYVLDRLVAEENPESYFGHAFQTILAQLDDAFRPPDGATP